MPRISLLISDEDLALIDASASPNRSAFMVRASREAAERVRRAREDAEIEAAVRASADEDAAVTREWDCTLEDGEW